MQISKIIVPLAALFISFTAEGAKASFDNCQGQLPGGESVELTSSDLDRFPQYVTIESTNTYHVAEVEVDRENPQKRIYQGNPDQSDDGMYRYTFSMEVDRTSCTPESQGNECQGTVTSSVLAGGQTIRLRCFIDISPPEPSTHHCPGSPHCKT